jgi:isoamylase
VLLAQGTPMLQAGDEFGRTQNGNNNTYGQDNQLSWVNWEAAGGFSELTQFVRQLIALRHRYPLLRRNRFLTGTYDDEYHIKDVMWLAPSGEEMSESHWTGQSTRCLGALITGQAQQTGIRKPGEDITLLLLVNAGHDDVTFHLPQTMVPNDWIGLIDTSPGMSANRSARLKGASVELAARSMRLLRNRQRPKPLGDV